METTTKQAQRATTRKPAADLHTLSLTFRLPLKHRQIEAFRGAFADMAGKANDYFHNHNNSETGSAEVLYRYPRIQYRVHNGMATVFGINEGAVALSKLADSNQLEQFRMGGRHIPLQVSEMREVQHFKPKVMPRNQMQRYRIYRWLPLNQANYTLYKAYDKLTDKGPFLENILKGHIVDFAENMGWEIPTNRKIKVVINDIDRVTKVNLFDTDMVAFDLVFSTNALLPDRIGLGRKKAFGFGWIFRFNHEDE